MDKLIEWIAAQQDIIDESIKNAAADYFKHFRSQTNFFFDVKECELESLALSSGEDLCYDRPSIGFSYSLWYHGRRINSLLRFFAEKLYENRDSTIHVFDLGAGTGAVQSAIGIVLAGIEALGLPQPNVRVTNIDTSPFMLEYNRSYLWKWLKSRYPILKKIKCEYQVNSWSNPDSFQSTNLWICASYLFDHSEHIDDLTESFERIVQAVNPAAILLTSSSGKRKLLEKASDRLSKLNFEYSTVDLRSVFSGPLRQVHAGRAWLTNNTELNFRTVPSWDERSIHGVFLTSRNERFAFDFDSQDTSINLYSPPLVVRRDIKLNDKQLEAASIPNTPRPTCITGPAGSGKSIVISERIKNLLTQPLRSRRLPYDPKIRILITTFNKPLTNHLSDWLWDILDESKVERNGIHFKFENSDYDNIQLMNFDVLPTRIGRVHRSSSAENQSPSLRYEATHLEIIKGIIQTEFDTGNWPNIKNRDLFSPQYVFSEYHRYMYGLNITKFDDYLNIERPGSGGIGGGSNQRNFVLAVIRRWLNTCREQNITSFTRRRWQFLFQLQKGRNNGIYDYIFVDEFQDCTPADFSIFYHLLKDNNNLILAGDLAQAIHLGTSSTLPREDNSPDDKLRYFDYIKLEGSYRLPYRISECLKPISETIKIAQEDAQIITPYKGSPPGARPIVVYAESSESMAQKIIDITDSFAPFDILNQAEQGGKKITILERDNSLVRELVKIKPGCATTSSILKLKGLEKTCVLWSTRATIEYQREVNNFVYTILTRTSGILIIALFPETQSYYEPIVNQLPSKRLIMWDEETKEHMIKKYSEQNGRV